MYIPSKIFRQYDIRGEADTELHDDLVCALGQALALHLGTPNPVIAVGRDCRLTSPRLFEALTQGMRSQGATIVDVGVIPTPVLYFAAHHITPDGAVIITGSHNPAQDNGFKMLRGISSLYGDEIAQLLTRIQGGVSPCYTAADEGFGSLQSCDLVPAYLAYMRSTLQLGDKRPKVVVDAGNGTGGPLAMALYQELGFETIALHCEMDGRFPNHHPDPTVEANLEDLKDAVRHHQADLGIALDGDADRIGAVDAQGRVLWGDQLLILFGRALLSEVPGATILGEVKCSQSLYDEIEKAGGNALMSQVGHSLIKARMKESGALLAGEMSGHIFFAHRFLGFDDGVYAGARLLEILSTTSKSLAQLYDTLPTMVNTPELRVPCSDESKFAVVQKVTQAMREHAQVQKVIDIDGVRAHFSDGWGLVRASNTQASLVLRCEAHTPKRLQEIRSILENAIQHASKEA